jgi:tetratricopeptide (TPR) repeat protein
MYVRELLLLTCFGAATIPGAEFTVAIRSAVADELIRATQLERSGDLREAERIVQKVIRGAEAGGPSLELALAVNNLGTLYTATDRYADAERQFRRSIRVLEALDGDTAAQALAKGKLHLAQLYLETGRSAEVGKLDLPAVIASLRSPEDQARAKTILAGLKIVRKEFDAAEQIYLELLSFWTDPSRAAASQTETGTIRNNLGVIALWQGRTDVARARLEESFEHWQQIVGPENPNMVKAMANVASVYMELKQYDEAVKWLNRSASIGRRAFGELHPFFIGIQLAQADALKKAGRKAEAKEIASAAAEARRMMRRPSVADYTVDVREVNALRAEPPRR